MKDSRRNLFTLRAFFREYLDLEKEQANKTEVDQYIREGIEYKGSRLWILILSILIASLGLNVNAIYVIIGAMLISPMMGPIMGVGMSLGINDFELMKHSLKSYVITTLFSVVTSTVYFLISPITVAPSEFIFQTSPSFYNVLIALFGGLAGFIALSTTKKGTVLVGVAIVTALMPPLCTAGYGLSSGNLVVFLGALYLYFIDSVFICFATFLGVRMLHFTKKEFINKKQERNVRKYMFIVIILSMIPTIYLTTGIIHTAIFNARANRFVTEQFNFRGTSVMYNKCMYDHNGAQLIQVVLVGKEISQSSIEQVRAKLPDYQLENTELEVLQGMKHDEITTGHIRGMINDVYRRTPAPRDSTTKISAMSVADLELNKFIPNKQRSAELVPEVEVLFPSVIDFTVGRMYQSAANGTQQVDTLYMAFVKTDNPKKIESGKLSAWLQARLGIKKNINVIINK